MQKEKTINVYNCILIIYLFECHLNKRNLSSINSMIQGQNQENNVVNLDKTLNKETAILKREIKDMYRIQKNHLQPDKMFSET